MANELSTITALIVSGFVSHPDIEIHVQAAILAKAQALKPSSKPGTFPYSNIH